MNSYRTRRPGWSSHLPGLAPTEPAQWQGRWPRPLPPACGTRSWTLYQQWRGSHCRSACPWRNPEGPCCASQPPQQPLGAGSDLALAAATHHLRQAAVPSRESTAREPFAFPPQSGRVAALRGPAVPACLPADGPRTGTLRLCIP